MWHEKESAAVRVDEGVALVLSVAFVKVEKIAVGASATFARL